MPDRAVPDALQRPPYSSLYAVSGHLEACSFIARHPRTRRSDIGIAAIPIRSAAGAIHSHACPCRSGGLSARRLFVLVPKGFDMPLAPGRATVVLRHFTSSVLSIRVWHYLTRPSCARVMRVSVSLNQLKFLTIRSPILDVLREPGDALWWSRNWRDPRFCHRTVVTPFRCLPFSFLFLAQGRRMF